MKENKFKKKDMVTSMALMVGLLLPMTMNAQQNYNDSGGLFMRGPKVESNNRNNSVSLGGATQENPTDVPLGNGILVLVTFGLSYASIRKKEDKK